MPTKTRLEIARRPYPAPAYRLILLGYGRDVDKLYLPYDQLDGGNPLAAARREHVAFVVLKRYNTEDPRVVPFITALAREGRRMAVFSPYRERSGARPEPFLHNTDARIDRVARATRSGRGDLANRWPWFVSSATDWRPRRGRCRSPVTRGRAIAAARYEGRIRASSTDGTGRADRLPMGAVYEATMRCNLHCEFCYVGDLLNIEGEWRQELPLEALAQAFPDTGRLPDQPDRRRDLHAQGHHVRAGSLPRPRATPAAT